MIGSRELLAYRYRALQLTPQQRPERYGMWIKLTIAGLQRLDGALLRTSSISALSLKILKKSHQGEHVTFVISYAILYDRLLQPHTIS